MPLDHEFVSVKHVQAKAVSQQLIRKQSPPLAQLLAPCRVQSVSPPFAEKGGVRGKQEGRSSWPYPALKYVSCAPRCM